MSDQFYKKFETLMNRYLALDPESIERIKKLDGKIITLNLTLGKLEKSLVSLQLKCRQQHIFIQKPVETADVTITGTPLSLIHLSFAPKKARKTFFSEKVTIEGDLEIAPLVLNLLDDMEIDWEEHLSKLTGDSVAHQIGRLATIGKNFLRKTSETLLQSTNEYLHEEAEIFPPREEMEDFFKAIDELREDADRLESRVALLTGNRV